MNFVNLFLWSAENCAKAVQFIELIKGKMQNRGQYRLQVMEEFWEEIGEGHLPKNVELRKVMATNLEALLSAIGVEHLGTLFVDLRELDDLK